MFACMVVGINMAKASPIASYVLVCVHLFPLNMFAICSLSNFKDEAPLQILPGFDGVF